MTKIKYDINFARLGRDVKKTRWDRDLTQTEAAFAAGVSYGEIQKIEQGRPCNLVTLLPLCEWVDRHPARYVDVRDAP